ncbi:MAG: response regulator, partial [Byssovorax sp.]
MSEISVLLVEDDARLARFTSAFLRKNGVAVTHAADGLVAVREALTKQHDVVVLDLMLPGKDGLSVCREIRAASDVPILMVTARAEEVDRILGLELGAD